MFMQLAAVMISGLTKCSEYSQNSLLITLHVNFKTTKHYFLLNYNNNRKKKLASTFKRFPEGFFKKIWFYKNWQPKMECAKRLKIEVEKKSRTVGNVICWELTDRNECLSVAKTRMLLMPHYWLPVSHGYLVDFINSLTLH